MASQIDLDLVRHIGKLSRIELTDKEAEMFRRQLGSILEHFDKLRELDTTGVEPMAHAVEIRNALADDVARESLSPDEALANAPRRDADHFMVPRVIQESS